MTSNDLGPAHRGAFEDVPVSQMNFLMDDCEVVLIGIKGSYLPFNDNCRSRRLHCCNKCRKPIVIFGRLLDCKHAFCEQCALAAKNEGCYICGENVREVHPFSIEKGDISICEYIDSRGACQRTYMTAEDLLEHQRLRNHLLPPKEDDLMMNMCNARPLPSRDQVQSGTWDGARQGFSGSVGTPISNSGSFSSVRTTGSKKLAFQPRLPYSRPIRPVGRGATPGGWPSPKPKSGHSATGASFTKWTPRAAGGQGSAKNGLQ